MKLLLLSLLCALLWGSAFPGIKYVYREWGTCGFETRIFFAGIRFTIAGLILFALTKSPIAKLRKVRTIHIVALALTQTYIQYLCFYTGLYVSGGILASLIVASGSFWWMLLAPLLLKTQWPSASQWLLLTIATAGVALAIYAPGAGSGDVSTGVTFFLISTVSGTIAVILMRMMSHDIGARTATAASLTLGGLLLLLTGAGGAADFFYLLTPSTAFMTFYLAIVSATAFSVWNWLATTHSVAILASYRFLIPLSGMIQSSIFIANESPGTGIYIGAPLVIFSIYFMNRSVMKGNPAGYHSQDVRGK